LWNRFVTRHTLVWKVILVVVFLCPVTDMSAMVAPIGVKFCVMVHIGPGQIFLPFGGDTPRETHKSEYAGLNFGNVTTNISKTISRSVTCQLELNISARQELSNKC